MPLVAALSRQERCGFNQLQENKETAMSTSVVNVGKYEVESVDFCPEKLSRLICSRMGSMIGVDLRVSLMPDAQKAMIERGTCHRTFEKEVQQHIRTRLDT